MWLPSTSLSSCPFPLRIARRLHIKTLTHYSGFRVPSSGKLPRTETGLDPSVWNPGNAERASIFGSDPLCVASRSMVHPGRFRATPPAPVLLCSRCRSPHVSGEASETPTLPSCAEPDGFFLHV